MFRRSYIAIQSDVVFKRISISIRTYSSIILRQTNSFTSLNASSSPNCILFEVRDGMSNSNTIINHHYPISLCLQTRNCYHLLWLEIEKEDLINQSSSLILFIINSFDSPVYLSPSKAPNPRVMDWSRFRSHSLFSQSFILSNIILWHQ